MVDDPLSDVVIPPYPCPPSRTSLADWYAEAATLDHLHFAPPDHSFWWAQAEREQRGELVRELARKGFTFDQIAGMVRDEPEAVARAVSKGDRYIEQVLVMERTWRAHPSWSVAQIAREAGVHKDTARIFLGSLGHVAKSAYYKHDSAETYEKIRKLRESGYSFGKIGKMLGLASGTVFHMHKRRYGTVDA